MNPKTSDKIWTLVLYIVSSLIVLLLVSLIGYILFKGIGVITPHFLFGNPEFTKAGGGIGPQLFNSFYMLVVTLIITIPLGIGAGIFLSEYTKEGRIVSFIRLCIETLSSLPSIVVGLFSLLVFVQMAHWGYSLLAGALAITILNIPSMTRVSENAIKAAGVSVKEASLGLGATQSQTIRKVILPAAMPQILTGIILAAGRIFGEAAALIYSAGMSASILNFNNLSFINKSSPLSLFKSSETLAVYIWQVNSEGMLPDAARVANGASAVLIIMVLIFNFGARLIGKKIYEAHTGKK